MILKTKGITQNIDGTLIGRVTRNLNNTDNNAVILMDNYVDLPSKEFIGY